MQANCIQAGPESVFDGFRPCCWFINGGSGNFFREGSYFQYVFRYTPASASDNWNFSTNFSRHCPGDRCSSLQVSIRACIPFFRFLSRCPFQSLFRYPSQSPFQSLSQSLSLPVLPVHLQTVPLMLRTSSCPPRIVSDWP